MEKSRIKKFNMKEKPKKLDNIGFYFFGSELNLVYFNPPRFGFYFCAFPQLTNFTFLICITYPNSFEHEEKKRGDRIQFF